MRTFLRAAGIILIALLASVILFALLVTFTNTFTVIEEHPAQYLPETQTIALLMNPSTEMLTALTPVFPVLANTELSGQKAIALVKWENATETIEFWDHSPADSAESFGRFSVTSSVPATLALLRTSTPRLASLNAFTKLSDQKTPQKSWAFLTLSSLPKAQSTLQRLITALISQESTHAAFSITPDIISIDLIGTQTPPGQGLSPVIRSTFDAEQCVVRAAHFSQQWNTMINNVDIDTQIRVQGRLEHVLQEIVGEEVSLTYDLLPLLSGPTSIHKGLSASGTLILAVEGIGPNISTLRSVITQLEEGFRATVPSTKITERNLDNRFVSRDIRITEEETTLREDHRDQWSVRGLHASDGRMLMSAQRGASFILANDESALLQLLHNDASITPPTGPTLSSTVRLADGWCNASLIPEFLPLMKENVQKILWSVEQRGPVTTLMVQGVRK
ncbi:MAG: hypothetical protein WCX61_01175 [Candidatus Peribacteraceae bacterium]